MPREPYAALLQPAQLWAGQVLCQNLAVIPPQPGLYAWYFREVPPEIPVAHCHTYQGATLLYVGIARHQPDSGQTLRGRLRNHLKGNASGSTLRLSLGCLLRERLGLQLRPVGRRLTFATGEKQLSQWLAAYGWVAWLEAAAPWEWETALLQRVAPPLNLRGNAGQPFHAALTAARRLARHQARALPPVVA